MTVPAEITKWHLRHSNCKQVILGISHDAGYAPFLDELFQDAALRIRLTVLEGVPAVRELLATGVNVLNLNDSLFRADKLVDRTPPPPPKAKPEPVVVQVAVPVPVEVKPAVAPAPAPATSSVASVGNPTPATSVASTPAQAPATTYARAAKIPTPPPVVAVPVQTKTAPVAPVSAPAAARNAQAKPGSW